jgi:uncharacterized protein YceH (UPF0502 family)
MTTAAQVIFGGAGVVLALSLLVWVLQRRPGSAQFGVGAVSAKFEALDAKLDRIHGTAHQAAVNATEANRAVNNVPKGTPPLVQRVAAIEQQTARIERNLDRISTHVGIDPEEHPS